MKKILVLLALAMCGTSLEAGALDKKALAREIAWANIDMRAHLGAPDFATPYCPDLTASITIPGEASLRYEEAKKRLVAEDRVRRTAQKNLELITRLMAGESSAAARDIVAEARRQLDAAVARRAKAGDRVALYETILRRFGGNGDAVATYLKVGTDISCDP